MRPSSRTALLVLLVLGAWSAPVSAAGPLPDDLPPGFVDGEPVGDATGGPAATPPAPAATDGAAPAAVTTRYFGASAYAAVEGAVAATPRCSTLGPLQLTYSILAPAFKESSAATTAATAPSPMTLSRYDEWNGTFSTASNRSANYGLYAFRDPSTPYKRAFWHPGTGIWQYDSAGVGAPFTTIEVMDVRIVALDLAETMQASWCGASGTAAAKRQQAWRPWWSDTDGNGTSDSCPLCEGFYQDLVATDGPSLVPGIGPLGGVEQRSCQLPDTTEHTCWFVDPDRSQGATAWKLQPLDGGSSTVAPTPLSAPFYVIERSGLEERYWLRDDSGYAVDIRGQRQIGGNARPRTGQPTSGVTWSSGDGLCDLTVLRGRCDLLPPAGVHLTRADSLNGRIPVVADLDGDGDDDVILYGPGSTSDQIVWTDGPATFRRVATSVSGTYEPVVADLDGNGRDEVLWYSPSAGTVSRWQWNGAAFAISQHAPGAGKQPLVGDVDGNGDDEVHWYGAGSATDPFWDHRSGVLQTSIRNVSGTYEPIVGDLDGNGTDDVLWYGVGAARDSLWLYRQSGPAYLATNVSGTYDPFVGDLDGDGADDIVWYAAGAGNDALWWGRPGGVPLPGSLDVDGTYVPVVADVQGDGRDDVLWYGPGTAADRWFRWTTGRVQSVSSGLTITGTYEPLPGRFGHPGRSGIFWYGGSDAYWWR